MNDLKSIISRSTMAIFIIAIMLLIYGYLCRLVHLYFFWDSKSFGWVVMIIGLIAFLNDIKKTRASQQKKILGVKLAVGFIILGLLVGAGAIVLFKNSNAYQNAVELIKTEELIKKEVGDVHGFGLVPLGLEISKTFNDGRSATFGFTITVRGKKAYRDVKITFERGPQMTWIIRSITIIYI